MLSLFELELNGYTLLKLGKRVLPSKNNPWVIIGLRLPSISLPFFRRNNLGEWERLFAISFPTILQIAVVKNISWEVHLRIFGFGFSFCYQYGY